MKLKKILCTMMESIQQVQNFGEENTVSIKTEMGAEINE